MNSLLYTIRGYKVGDPAFTFDTESKGFDKSVWSKVGQSKINSILQLQNTTNKEDNTAVTKAANIKSEDMYAK